MRKVLVGVASALGAIGLVAAPATAAPLFEINDTGRAEPSGAAVIKYFLDCGRGDTARVHLEVTQGRASGVYDEVVSCDASPTRPKTAVVWPSTRRDFKPGEAFVQGTVNIYNDNGNTINSLSDSETVTLKPSP